MKRSLAMPIATAVAGTAAALLLAGCGGSGSGTSSASAASTPAVSSSAPTTPSASPTPTESSESPTSEPASSAATAGGDVESWSDELYQSLDVSSDTLLVEQLVTAVEDPDRVAQAEALGITYDVSVKKATAEVTATDGTKTCTVDVDDKEQVAGFGCY